MGTLKKMLLERQFCVCKMLILQVQFPMYEIGQLNIYFHYSLNNLQYIFQHVTS